MATQEWREANKEKMREYRREWYNKNKEHAKGKIQERREELVTWFKDLKSKLKCCKCGEDFIYCLEFHHTDPNEKEFTITKAVNNGLGREKILEEIDKCVVLCANCHRKEHYAEYQFDSGMTCQISKIN